MNRSHHLLAVVALVALNLLARDAIAAEPKSPSARVDPRLAAIDHWIIIYQENWSFDGLYGKFPGADGLANAEPTVPQVDRDGKRLTNFPEISSDPVVPPGLPIGPVDLTQFVDLTVPTKDLAHRFYTEQLQIDNGRLEPSSGSMDKFVAWSDNPSLVMSYRDSTTLPEGRLAQQYLLCDHFFHAAFGGSFLNHQFLVSAQAPRWNQPLPARATFKSSFDATPGHKTLIDGNLTRDGSRLVNTTFSAVAPHPNVPQDELLHEINNVNPRLSNYTPTIGDRLDKADVSWRWYAGGWKNALDGKPDKSFQFHHQPFAYYERYAPFAADGTPNQGNYPCPMARLQDESQFYIDLATGNLPAVSFIKPLGVLSEHPAHSTLSPGQQHVADIVHAVMNSPLWRHTAIIINYDDHGGRWDHVPPPRRDEFGPGSRTPTIVISPYTWRGGVNHETYDTLSILKTLEDRYAMPPLNQRDAAAANLAACFQATPHPAIDISYLQPDADRPSRSVLVVGGTPWADQIHISQEDEWTVVHIRSAGNVTGRRSKFRTAHISRIEVFGQGGDDNIQIESPVALPALILCGTGTNFVRTGGGPSVVVGAGQSEIEGGTGRNVLIGGSGTCSIKAGPRGDILIAGSTDYDADLGALRAISQAWAAPDLAYVDRVARLSGSTSASGGSPVLTPAHVHPGSGKYTLQGGPNSDWFFVKKDAPDAIKNRSPGAVVTGI